RIGRDEPRPRGHERLHGRLRPRPARHAAALGSGQVRRAPRDRDEAGGGTEEDREGQLPRRPSTPGPVGTDPRRQGALPEPQGQGHPPPRDEGGPRRRPALSPRAGDSRSTPPPDRSSTRVSEAHSREEGYR